jgi:hypothetical protein
MHFENQNERVLASVAASIRLTPGAEIVRAAPDLIVFYGNRPRRTFEIGREGAHGFRVEETMVFQAAGRSGQPASCHQRNVINKSQMTKWVSARLEEIRASTIYSGGLTLPEGSTVLMMMLSALITFWTLAA